MFNKNKFNNKKSNNFLRLTTLGGCGAADVLVVPLSVQSAAAWRIRCCRFGTCRLMERRPIAGA